MFTSPEANDDWPERLKDLGKKFATLASTVPVAPPLSREVWAPLPPSQIALIYEKECQDHRARYDNALDEAGGALLELANGGLITGDDRLLAVVAAYELHSWGGFVRTLADLFVLYAGGLRIELHTPNGEVEEYEAVGDDIPPQIRPLGGKVLTPATRRALGVPLPVDPLRCERYAQTCLGLTDRLPPLPPKPGGTAADTRLKRGEAPIRALLVLKDHPDWSVERIASEVGCAFQTLNRNKVFRKAFDEAHQGEPPPKGFRRFDRSTGQPGDVEAFDSTP
jgi:hypothetical protein